MFSKFGVSEHQVEQLLGEVDLFSMSFCMALLVVSGNERIPGVVCPFPGLSTSSGL